MNLNSHERLKSLVKECKWHDQILHVRKLTVAKWRDLTEERPQAVKDDNDEEGGIWWSAKVLSQCLCDSSGTLTHDSLDKRKELEQLSPAEIEDLLRLALTWSGVWKEDQKKS